MTVLTTVVEVGAAGEGAVTWPTPLQRQYTLGCHTLTFAPNTEAVGTLIVGHHG